MAREVCCYKELLKEYREQIIEYYQNGNYFKDLKPYDVVWCLMPLTKDQLDKVPRGHEIRPYVIIGKKENSLLGYHCTTNLKSWEKNKYVINKEKYCHDKDTVILLSKVFEIPKDNFKGKLFTLDDVDIQGINKKINTIQNEYAQVELNVGDVIFDQRTIKTYYIYNIKDCYAYGYAINRNKEKNDVKICECKYEINLSDEKRFLRKGLFKVLNIATYQERNCIDEIIKLKTKKTIQIAQVGDLIDRDNNLYYVYASDCITTYCYLVHKQKEELEEKIIVNNKPYCFNLKKIIQFESNCLNSIVDQANAVEIIYNKKIKDSRKREIKNQEKNEKQKVKDSLVIKRENPKQGMIFKFHDRWFVYVYSKGNYLYCVDLLMYKAIFKIIKFKEIPITENYISNEEYQDILLCLANKNGKKRELQNKLYHYRKEHFFR